MMSQEPRREGNSKSKLNKNVRISLHSRLKLKLQARMHLIKNKA
jgi:hypothetical protein